MNGTTYRKSRYFTFNAASQVPAPADASRAIAVKMGNASNATPGQTLYHTIKIASSAIENAKSTNETMTELAGTIRRGKYTLEIRFALLIRLLLPSVSEVAN